MYKLELTSKIKGVTKKGYIQRNSRQTIWSGQEARLWKTEAGAMRFATKHGWDTQYSAKPILA